MSQKDVEIFPRLADAFNRRDLPAFLSCCDTNIEVVSERALIGAPTYRGHSGMERFFRDVAVAWEELGGKLGDVVAIDDATFVVTSESSGRGRRTGAPFAAHTASYVKLKQGKVVRWEFFATERDALEAAGLSE